MDIRTGVLEFDGYRVGDRLLEGCVFQVEIIEIDGNLIVGSVTPSEKDKPYLRNIRWENFVIAIKNSVINTINHLRSYAEGEGRTINQELDIYQEEEPEANRYSLLAEI